MIASMILLNDRTNAFTHGPTSAFPFAASLILPTVSSISLFANTHSSSLASGITPSSAVSIALDAVGGPRL